MPRQIWVPSASFWIFFLASSIFQTLNNLKISLEKLCTSSNTQTLSEFISASAYQPLSCGVCVMHQKKRSRHGSSFERQSKACLYKFSGELVIYAVCVKDASSVWKMRANPAIYADWEIWVDGTCLSMKWCRNSKSRFQLAVGIEVSMYKRCDEDRVGEVVVLFLSP